jgi:hypothetical protein
MIDGAHEGAFATHPTIAERVAAIVSVTGSMALIAPGRRDTRPPELRAREGFGRRAAPALEAAFLGDARQSVSAALARVSSDNEFNRLGLTREMSVGAIAAVGVFLRVHSADLRNPAALTKAFDPAPVRTFFAMAGEGRRCLWQGLGSVIGLAKKPTDCDLDKRFAAYRDNDGVIGAIADTMANQTKGVYAWPDGSFRNAAPPIIQLAEIREARCFQTESYSVGDRGLHSVTEQPKQGDTISLPRYLGYSDAAARSVTEASPAERDARLLDYFKVRKTMGLVIHRFFGDPGLQEAAVRYGYYAHQTAIAMLRQRLTDPSFASTLNPLERAELDLLAAAPQDFVSCTARRAQRQTRS